MMKLRNHVLKNKILYRMIAGYTLISTIIILCMTSFMYNAFRIGIENEIFRFQEQSLKQVANTVGFRAEYVNSLMQQAMQDKDISKLFYPAQKDSIDGLRNLADLRISVKQLQSIYIYNEYENTIYCSGEQYLSSISNLDSFEDQGFIDIIDHIDQYAKYTPILRRVSLESPNGKEYSTYVYTYLLFDTLSSGKVNNIMAFNFYLGWMEDALDFITNGESTLKHIWIANKNKQIVYSDTGELIGTTYDAELIPDTIYENPSGYIITGSWDDRQMLVYATPEHSGYENWTFVSWNDYSELLEPLTHIRMFINIIFATALIISALIIIMLSKYIYKFVKQTIDKVETLEMEQAKKLKIDRTLFLRKLFLGNESDDIQKIKENFEKHSITYELDADSQVVLVSVDYSNSFLRKFSKELERIDDVMQDLLTEKFEAVYHSVIVVKMQDGIWGICIPIIEEEGKIAELFTEINASLEELLEITISMAISEHGYSVRDIPYLYSEAINIHSYRYLLGQNQIITADDIKEQEQRKFEYPREAEKKLLSCLFSGKSNETDKAYKEFVQEVRRYPVGEVKLSFMLLAYAIKNASSNTTAEVSSILMEFDKFYKRLQMLETIDEVNQMFIHLIGEIIDKLQLHALERHEMLISQIKDYVAKNYGKISLSMNEVSDYVDMSAAYLGRLFKQVTEITFTEYLTKFRLNTACDLLQNTEKTVNEISDEVGFTNSSYFYIVFKKNLGCTPNQYRKKQSGDSEGVG